MDRRTKTFDAKCKILLGVLILAVIIGLGTATYANSVKPSGNLRIDRPSLFDPFELSRIAYVAEENPTVTLANRSSSRDYRRKSLRGLVWVPRRPVCRSAIRPLWTP